MLSNFHTHTTLCDGNNTAEEIVRYAIDKGFDAIGFSGHGYTDFDFTYCMKNMEEYASEIKRLKEKYKNKIQVYLGVEEDSYGPVEREKYDYIIGSSHYFFVNGKYYSIDHSFDCFKKCLELFNYDVITLSETYYKAFCEYILKRKPDIVGHFDLITKYDEIDVPRFLCNEEYLKVADKYMKEAIKSGSVFEVNTGAISRGYRKNPYPHENLLHILKKNESKLMLSSDSHAVETLDFYFNEARAILKEVGFKHIYSFYDNELKRFEI